MASQIASLHSWKAFAAKRSKILLSQAFCVHNTYKYAVKLRPKNQGNCLFAWLLFQTRQLRRLTNSSIRLHCRQQRHFRNNDFGQLIMEQFRYMIEQSNTIYHDFINYHLFNTSMVSLLRYPPNFFFFYTDIHLISLMYCKD